MLQQPVNRQTMIPNRCGTVRSKNYLYDIHWVGIMDNFLSAQHVLSSGKRLCMNGALSLCPLFQPQDAWLALNYSLLFVFFSVSTHRQYRFINKIDE